MKYSKEEISCPYCGGTGDGPGADCGFCDEGKLTVTGIFGRLLDITDAMREDDGPG